MKNVIQARELSRVYRDTAVPVHALREVDLDFRAGEFSAVVGPSGSGKTTLLNVIGGLDRPDGGRVIIGGQDITRLGESRLFDFRLRHIGFVFQSFNLLPVLTALENVSLVMQLQRHPPAAADARAREMLAQVGLAERMHVRPGRLSGGQQQRVAVARALAARPDFILADEPTANLDTAAAFNLLDIMARLNREEGTTMIFSTHDQRVIQRARRVIRLVDGAVESDRERPGGEAENG